MAFFEDGKINVWYDAFTGKQVRYGAAIAKHLRNSGKNVLLTTRKHPDTLSLAEFLKEEIIVVGRYDPTSLLTRLREGVKRELLFCDMFGKIAPNVAISHGSVDLCRVAFGLGIPLIVTFDTPYSVIPHRLMLPLAKYVVASKAIPKRFIDKYAIEAEIVDFNGIDEVAWIQGFVPTVRYDLGKPLIVVRELEEKAIYTQDSLDMLGLSRKLTRLGKVVFLSRYERRKSKNLIVPDKFVDSASLVSQADLFIGMGGTITREAALLGTPSILIDLFPGQFVNDFLIEKGFPIFRTKPEGVYDLAEKLLGRRYDTTQMLNDLENPVNVIASIITRICEK